MINGLMSLIPVAIVLGTALVTKRTFDSILYGIITGFILMGGGDLHESLNLFIDGLYKAILDANIIWIILIIVLLGGWAALVEGSGGAQGFSKVVGKLAKTRKASLLGAWVLSALFYFDGYLSVFVVSVIMKKNTDKFKISREMLTFIINSTGVTICVIVPFSSWAVFMLGLMEKTGMTQGLSPIAAYMRTIPYIVYGWLTLLTVPLFAVGVLPLFGPMKKSESRALETGQVLPVMSLKVPTKSEEEAHPLSKQRAVNFVIPVVLLAAVTVITKDILLGLLAALILCFALYIPQKLMKLGEYFSLLKKGIVDMFPVAAIIILAFIFQIINKRLGLEDFIIDITLNYIPGAFLPVTIFIVMAFLSFVTGTFWWIAAITFPIVECLAAILGVNPFLCAGALISAIAFSEHICIYSDTALLTGALTKVANHDYFKTSFPLIVVPFSLSAILYVILGFLIA